MKKAALHNLGCKVNAYETEAMQHLLEEAGYEIVPFTQKADVYVINTCSVTNMADRKSRQMLHKAKKNNPDSIVVAAGCYVQTSEKEVLNDLSVDIVIGNDRKHDLVRLLDEYSLDSVNDTVDDINDGKHDFEELFIDQTKEHTRAFIKVQDGCNQFCSYCIIPYARGRVRSRRFENVIAEVERLAANGFKEVVLTGIHLSSYGVDFEEATGLLELIQAVNAVKGIERIRLGSLEPKIVTEHFASELSKLDKICPHFHLSLQSGCDATLKRMNRKYTTKEYERGCELLRKYFVHPAITTDVIVGFPGETEEEFEQTKAYLEHIHFYEMHIFKYSKRKGTRAAVMPDQIDEQIKAARSEKLIALGHDMSKEFRKFYIGKNEEVLFEEKAVIGDKEYFVGYTKEYVKVAKETAENLENQIVSGRISGMLTDEILLFE
ncbi:tRNA (N(6)-L-threonylcarbamoyladenosine(37)-C(2))-methylthiotransferase MtaB [Agathobacter rectalis]|uniref:Threonylcarbamoyladenosine tRNA methylthiotransferase MtaB n=1 Tax=Agathobacter rectalis TaxID=39491 RepID=A0A0M6WJM5_9FIRM|nr:tRNA (N(6)-L-threonylcarbamoyladenosine(37)-C(2))-methylthiotransferase MtaB [Agathobacter rectalis]CRL37043.1 MiaB-like tRNA modifying enzyme [Agathobacter rectalis]